MDARPSQLPISPAAAQDLRAVEMLRVWVAGGSQHLSLNPGPWSDPAHWGIMLVDLAKYIANAYEATNRMKKEAALDRLRHGWD